MVVYFNITNHIAIAISVKNKHNVLYFLNCAALAETLLWTYNINIRTSYMSHHSGHRSEVDLGVLQVKGQGWWRSTNWAAKEWMGFVLDPFVDACSSVLMELSLLMYSRAKCRLGPRCGAQQDTSPMRGQILEICYCWTHCETSSSSKDTKESFLLSVSQRFMFNAVMSTTLKRKRSSHCSFK